MKWIILLLLLALTGCQHYIKVNMDDIDPASDVFYISGWLGKPDYHEGWYCTTYNDKDVVGYIMEKHQKGKKLTIVGQSIGGETANDAAWELYYKGIVVNDLILLDPVPTRDTVLFYTPPTSHTICYLRPAWSRIFPPYSKGIVVPPPKNPTQ